MAGIDKRVPNNSIGHRKLRIDILVYILGHDFKVYNTAPLFSSSSLGLGGKLGDVASDTVVKARAKCDDQISFLHRHICKWGAVHAKHIKRFFIKLIETTKALKGCCYGYRSLVCKLFEKLRPGG